MTWKDRDPMPSFLARQRDWWTKRLAGKTDEADREHCEHQIWLLSQNENFYGSG